MVTLEPVHRLIRKRKRDWGAIRDAFLTITDKEEDYYYQDVEETRTNYTKKELANIIDNTDIPLSISYTYSITNDKLSLLTNHDPSHKIISTKMNDKAAEEVALHLDEIKHSIMRDSLASIENEEVVKNYLTRGLGIGGLKRPEFYYEGEVPLRYKSIHPSECILDPNCKSLNPQDMEGYFLEEVLTRQRAQQFYQPLINAINEKAKRVQLPSYSGPIDISFFTKRSAGSNARLKLLANYDEGEVLVTEFVDKVYAEMLIVEDKNGILGYKFKENFDFPEEELALLGDSIKATIPGLYVRSTLMLNEWTVLQEIQPFTLYQIAVITHERRSRKSFYDTYSLVHFLKTMQEAFDKTISTMILNGMLINNAGYKAPINSIKNEDDWKTYGDPRIIKYYQPQVYEGKVFVPEREEVGQLSPYFPMLLQLVERAMKSVSGITDLLQGDPSTKIEVFATLQSYQSSAMERIKRDAKRINIFSTEVGKIVTEQIITILEPNILYGFQKETEFGSIRFNKDMINLIRNGKFRLISVPMDALPAQKMAIARELMQVAQSSQSTSTREILTEGAMKLSGIRAIQEIVGKIDYARQLEQQVEQYKEALDRSKEVDKQYENRALNAEHDTKVMRLMVTTALTIARQAGKAEGEIASFTEIEALRAQLKNKNGEENS